MAGNSPKMFQHYQSIYQEYTAQYGPHTGVFYKKGGFYNLFGQETTQGVPVNNVRELSDTLTLAVKECGALPNGHLGLFSGFPEQSLEKYASCVTRMGWHAVIVDEVHNGAGQVESRKVSRVLSPGTHAESAEGGSAYCIAALWFEAHASDPPFMAAVAMDVTTGATALYEGAAQGTDLLWHSDDVRHFFQVYTPRELVVFVREGDVEEEELRQRLSLGNLSLQIRRADDQKRLETEGVRERYLQEMYQPRNAMPIRTWLHLDGTRALERVLCSLITYVEDHIPSLAKSLQEPQIWHPDETLRVINNALVQLNLIPSGNGLPSIKDSFTPPKTRMGRRALAQRLSLPLTQTDAIQKRHEQIAWLLDHPDEQEGIRKALQTMYDLPRLHRNLVRGTITGADICQLYETYASAEFLWKAVQSSVFSPESAEKRTQIRLLKQTFERLFDYEKAKQIPDTQTQGELGFLQDVFQQSKQCERQIQDVHSAAKAWVAALERQCGLEQGAFTLLSMEKSAFVPSCSRTVLKQIEPKLKGYTFSTTKTEGRLDHPDLERFNSQLEFGKLALKRALSVEVPQACAEFVAETHLVWKSVEDWIVDIDLALSFATTAKEQGFCRPLLDSGNESGVWIQNLRHPLIEKQSRTTYVTHTVDLGYETNGGWLLYGMNASGKSSLMKAVGIAVLLAQVGSYVPATAMRLRPFKRVATRILNQDNLWAGLSSFAVEISELREILQVADTQTLVLGDELCAGTESVSATAIVASGIQYLHTAGARFMLATHLHDLTKFPDVMSSVSVWHLHVEYDRAKDCLVYHRDLRPGPGGTLYGLEVAKALHLPSAMLEQAYAYRKTLLGTASVDALTPSRYNEQVVRRRCEVCHLVIEKELEVHHVSPQEHAVKGRNPDGTALNHVSNLAVLCRRCHDLEHAGSVSVGPVLQTSEGPVRIIETASVSSVPSLESFRYVAKPQTQTHTPKKQTWTEEERETMKDAVRLYRSQGWANERLQVLKLKEDHGIVITEAALKRLKQSGFT